MRRAILLAVLAAFALAGTAAALAETKRVRTNLTIRLERTPAQDTVKGRVKAGEKACVERRRVELRRRPPGATEFQDETTVRTNRRGQWTFVPSADEDGRRRVAPGDYVAQVPRIHRRSGGKRLRCVAGESLTAYFG
jgi:hypothetical protein